MAVTPQTNTTLAEVAAALVERDDFCICGHVSPDGDCLGSQLALAHALRALGKRVMCVLARDEALDAGASSLPGAHDLVWAGSIDRACACFIAVDVPTRERLGDAARLLDAAKFTVTIDHHAVDHRMTELCYTDADAASTSLLVWELIGRLPVEADADMAACAFAGLMTDTGRFQYQNADARAFAAASAMVSCGAVPSRIGSAFYQNRTLASVKLEARALGNLRLVADGAAALSYISQEDMADCGAVKADAEPLVDIVRSIAGVRVACMLREQADGVRGSLRAKDGTDVSALARLFDGGGHKAAAGFTVRDRSVAEAADLLAGKLVELVEGGLDG